MSKKNFLLAWTAVFCLQTIADAARRHAHEGYFSWLGAVEWGCVGGMAILVIIHLTLR